MLIDPTENSSRKNTLQKVSESVTSGHLGIFTYVKCLYINAQSMANKQEESEICV